MALLKVRAVEEELQKRQKVNESKQHRAKLLQEKLSAIEAFRNEEKVKARTGVSSLRSVSGLSGSDTAMSLRSAIDEDLFYKQVVGKYALQQYKEIDVNVGRIGKLERRLQKLKEKRLKEAPAVK